MACFRTVKNIVFPFTNPSTLQWFTESLLFIRGSQPIGGVLQRLQTRWVVSGGVYSTAKKKLKFT